MNTIKIQIGERAAEVAAALADATEKLGRQRPQPIDVGPWQLLPLTADDDTMHSADSARRDLESMATPGRGFDHWNARPNLIKFVASGPLAAAYRATGDAGYAAAFRLLLEDYFLSLTRPKWAGAGMRLSQRIGRWAQFLPYFFDADVFDDAFVQTVFDHIPEQLASILKTHKIQARGNIRLLETEGLFQVGLRLPMLEQAGEAIERVRWVYADTARRAVYDDGSYCEYDPNYHGVFQSTFSNALLWRAAFPELELPDVRDTAVRVFNYACVSKSPIGHACGIQESPSPWIGERDCKEVLNRRQEVLRLAGCEPDDPPLVAACMNASQIFMRTGWEREAMFAAFDASRWGGAHSHLARNGVVLFKYGRALLPDTGSLTYAMDQKAHEGDELDHEIGPYGKSTRAHNTLNLNGWNQAPTNPDRLVLFTNADASAVYSKYSGGYWPGSYGWWFREGYGAGIHGEHERMLFWIADRFIVVVDRIMRWDETIHGHREQQEPTLEMNWQLSPGGEVDLRRDGFTAVYPEGGLLGCFAKLPAGMELTVHEGETDPPRGWITTRSKAQGDLRRAGVFEQPKMKEWANRSYAPAPQVAGVAAPMQGFGESIVSVFVPFEEEPPTIRPSVDGPIAADFPQSMRGRLEIEWSNGTRDLLAWSDRLAQPLIRVDDNGKEVLTDGCFLHLQKDADGSPVAGTALDASYARIPETDITIRTESSNYDY